MAIPNAYFFFSGRGRHTSCGRDWSSDVCSSDLETLFTSVLSNVGGFVSGFFWAKAALGQAHWHWHASPARFTPGAMYPPTTGVGVASGGGADRKSVV